MSKASLFPTQSTVLDTFLEGGLDNEVITTLYGPAGSGKTNLIMICLVSAIKQGKHVVFIDTEASFSAVRVQQLFPDFSKFAKQVLFLKPTTFEEQKQAFVKLKNYTDGNDVGLIIVDSIAMLYRIELGLTSDIAAVNRELSMQLGVLSEIARKKNIPVLIANQVYSDFENKQSVHMVGGDLLKYSSKCLIELRKYKNSVRVARIIKHRFIPEGKKAAFKIVNEGIVAVDNESVQPVENAYEQ